MLDTTYKSYQVTAPNLELPVTLERARQQLRNEDLNYDDEHVRGLIRTAADWVERTYGLALLNQTVRQYHSRFPCDTATPILLRIAPLYGATPIVSVVYVDSAGVSNVWDSDSYTTGYIDGRPVLLPKIGEEWPSGVATDHPNAVSITYTAGYGTKATNVPATIAQAILMQVTDLYENRGDPPRNMTTAAERLMQSFYRFAC